VEAIWKPLASRGPDAHLTYRANAAPDTPRRAQTRGRGILHALGAWPWGLSPRRETRPRRVVDGDGHRAFPQRLASNGRSTGVDRDRSPHRSRIAARAALIVCRFRRSVPADCRLSPRMTSIPVRRRSGHP